MNCLRFVCDIVYELPVMSVILSVTFGDMTYRKMSRMKVYEKSSVTCPLEKATLK